MDQRAILDHQFVVAAYVITWTCQLGYLAWLAWGLLILGLRYHVERRQQSIANQEAQEALNA